MTRLQSEENRCTVLHNTIDIPWPVELKCWATGDEECRNLPAYVIKFQVKTESIGKLSKFNFLWTKSCTLFKGYRYI